MYNITARIVDGSSLGTIVRFFEIRCGLNKIHNRDEENLIGFDVEWSFPGHGKKARPSLLVLCNGGGDCVVVPLDSFHGSLNPLLNFLRQPKFTFVGMGIKETVAALEREYGISCRNATDLGSLAAEIKNDPRLKACGMDLLMSEIGLSETHPSVKIFHHVSSESRNIYSIHEQVKAAAANCYAYRRIGKSLFKCS